MKTNRCGGRKSFCVMPHPAVCAAGIVFVCALVWLSIVRAQEQFNYASEGLRNPFAALVTSDGRLMRVSEEPDAKEKTLVIEGILFDPGSRSYVIANGEIIGVGGKVGDYEIVGIEQHKVLVKKAGEVTEILLYKEENK